MKKKRILQQVFVKMLRGFRCFLASLILFISLASTIHAQRQRAEINLSFEKATLKEVFESITTQVGYTFVYNEKSIQSVGYVNIKIHSENLTDVLDKCLAGTQLAYKIDKNVIVISENKKNSPVNISLNQTIKKKITGSVVDESGVSLPGVTILIKGLKRGTVTDVDGNFTLELENAEKQTLVFSFLGMETQEVLVGNKEKLVIKLKGSGFAISDVVVTGFFERKKESFTGAIASFTGEELKNANSVNILAAISILEPSFKVVENDIAGSNPNVIPDFVIRGEASLPNLVGDYKGNPNNPIFILDGFEISAEKVFDMDPTQVGSITILKDAASTAIYGSRASNGVVVIETKKTADGTINVSYNLDLSVIMPDLRGYNILNSSQKLELERQAGYYDKSGSASEDEKRADEYNAKLQLIMMGNNTYWLNKPLQNSVGHKHSFTIDGGENSLRYSLNANYDNNPGVMIGSKRDKIGVVSTLQYRFKNVTFKNYLSVDNVTSFNSPYGNFSQYSKINPYFAFNDNQGNYVKSFETGSWWLNIGNPLYNTTLNTKNESSYSMFINNFSIDWNIIPQLRLQANLSMNQRKDEGVIFMPADHTDFLGYSIPNYHLRGSYKSSEGKSFSYDGKVMLNYYNNYKNHMINAGLAINMQMMDGEDYSFSVQGFPNDKLDYLIFGLQYQEGTRPVGTDTRSRLIGALGSLNYSYNSKYLLDLSFRTDASSKFGADNRWAPFWSAGLGWNLHNEKFIKDLRFVDKLRLKASYGVTGSQNFDPYQSITRYQFYLTDKYNYAMGSYMMALGNSSLKWQTTYQLNTGFEFGFLKRFDVLVNVYRNLSTSLLSDITLPPSLGFSTYKENIGEMLNVGYEAYLKANIIKKKNVYLNINIGVIHNENTVEKISNSLRAWNDSQDEELTSGSNKPRVRYIEGQSINTIWGVPSVGINPANGKEIFITPNGERTDVWNAGYQQPIGGTDPDLEGNAGFNLGYKGLSLSLYFRYRMGGQMYNSTLVERVENADKRYNCDIRVLEERWKNPGDITFFKDIKDNTLTRPTSRFVEDYSFLQLSTVNLYYDFNKNLLSKFNVKSLRLSFSMNDIFRLTTVKAERGISYPFSSSFRTSLRIMF
ncbi:MAG: hypothetical protein A2X18_04985 [Bacteroidetes bacterium GWF2_40_14]|nr:MAG: hypothetical protein A2X18_04985 [Bacteroidetes bacterium GWF2_40_14]